MIIATKTVDSLLKGVISPDKLMISRIDSITKSIQLDPNITPPKKEMFIVSNDDVKNAKVRMEFEEAMKRKHPEVLVMYVNKNGREIPGMNEELFDAYVVKPKREDIHAKLISLVQETESKEKFKVSDEIQVPEKYVPPAATVQEELDMAEKEVSATLADNELVSVDLEAAINLVKEPEKEEDEPELLKRIKQSENWAALNAISQEVNASRIVREISEANVTFRQSENYITALSENIVAILSNPDYDTTTQLSKIRAVLHDKAYIRAKNNTILEQSVEQIVMAVVDKAKQEVESKTAEMDEKILSAFKKRSAEDAPNVRLSTIIENRSKVLIELTALDLELKGIASACIDTVNDTVETVISSSTSSTDSPILDSQMKTRFGTIVPENILTVLDNLFKLGEESSEEFGKMSVAIQSTVRKMYQLLSYYQEESEVLADTIRYLRANNVEETVLANTIMKKTNRLFVTNGDFDSVAITYLTSKHNSRKENNVLLLDLSGSDVFKMFGLKPMQYSDFMENADFEKKFLIVSTEGDKAVKVETDEDCQRLSTRLLHYAKHYSMVNIMCTPEQATIISNFKEDVLSITYVVDCFPSSIEKMSKCISDSKVGNTANKVVLTNYISDSTTICNELGIMDRLDMQLATCNPISAIRYCSLHKQDPYEVNSILEECGSVFSIC